MQDTYSEGTMELHQLRFTHQITMKHDQLLSRSLKQIPIEFVIMLLRQIRTTRRMPTPMSISGIQVYFTPMECGSVLHDQ